MKQVSCSACYQLVKATEKSGAKARSEILPAQLPHLETATPEAPRHLDERGHTVFCCFKLTGSCYWQPRNPSVHACLSVIRSPLASSGLF